MGNEHIFTQVIETSLHVDPLQMRSFLSLRTFATFMTIVILCNEQSPAPGHVHCTNGKILVVSVRF